MTITQSNSPSSFFLSSNPDDIKKMFHKHAIFSIQNEDHLSISKYRMYWLIQAIPKKTYCQIQYFYSPFSPIINIVHENPLCATGTTLFAGWRENLPKIYFGKMILSLNVAAFLHIFVKHMTAWGYTSKQISKQHALNILKRDKQTFVANDCLWQLWFVDLAT